jgi:hypothetical protein
MEKATRPLTTVSIHDFYDKTKSRTSGHLDPGLPRRRRVIEHPPARVRGHCDDV